MAKWIILMYFLSLHPQVVYKVKPVELFVTSPLTTPLQPAASRAESELEGYKTESQGWLIAAASSADAKRASGSEMNFRSADKLKQMEIGERFKIFKSFIKAGHFESFPSSVAKGYTWV